MNNQTVTLAFLVGKFEEARQAVLSLADYLSLRVEQRKKFFDSGAFSELIRKAKAQEKILYKDLDLIWMICNYLNHTQDGDLLRLAYGIKTTINLQLVINELRRLRGCANLLASQPGIDDYRFSETENFPQII